MRRMSRSKKSLRVVALVMLSALLAACAPIPRDVPREVAKEVAQEAAKDAAAAAATTATQPTLLERFARDQAALDALMARADLTRSFDAARAQAFVQHAYSALHENDRTGFIEAALGQAEGLIESLQSASAGAATQLIDAPERLRPDLWAVAERLHGNACAQAIAGRLEVQLVRAGHEHHSIGWRHANSHFAIAQDLADEAERDAAGCTLPTPTAR
jgi:hypothetical protein